MWTAEDSSALKMIFDFCWSIFNSKFQVLGYTTSWWQIMLSIFGIYLIFRIVRGLVEL